jgi:hypothetical protein
MQLQIKHNLSCHFDVEHVLQQEANTDSLLKYILKVRGGKCILA